MCSSDLKTRRLIHSTMQPGSVLTAYALLIVEQAIAEGSLLPDPND